jgi:hypothetical protein
VAAPLSTGVSAQGLVYAPQSSDIEVPQTPPLASPRPAYMAPPIKASSADDYSRLWTAGAGLTGSGLAVISVAAGMVFFGSVISLGCSDHPTSPCNQSSIITPGFVLGGAGLAAITIGIPMWIGAAVQRHRHRSAWQE